MPFVRRKVEPLGIRRQHENEGLKFEEYDDVSLLVILWTID